MILEIEHQRDTVRSLAEENSKLTSLVENLTLQIEAMREIAELHKASSTDRKLALELKDQIEKLYKDSLKEKDRRIGRLEKENGLLRKLTLFSFLFGLALGVVSQ